MTLREVIDQAFKTPDDKTTENNINNIEKIKEKADDKTKQELEAVAAELKAHKLADDAKKLEQQKKIIQTTTAQPVGSNKTAQQTISKTTAEV